MALDILKIIKYEGGPDQIVWKHPAEDFNTGSQLIVHESQEALFFKNGQALDLFGPGRYTLSTQNIPLLSKLINLPTGGESPSRFFLQRFPAGGYGPAISRKRSKNSVFCQAGLGPTATSFFMRGSPGSAAPRRRRDRAGCSSCCRNGSSAR